MPSEFSIQHRVQFSETDLAGIMHFSNYFRLMEEVEHAYFRSIGTSVVMQHDGMHIGWPRVAAGCEYFGPAKFEEVIDLKLRVARIGEKSFSFEVDFTIGDRRIALGKITSVCCTIEPGGMKSIAIPAPLREKIAGV
jgi:4-hydroxybenzoyl-CoA thioesterase/acyl-CoA thioester hydrolase